MTTYLIGAFLSLILASLAVYVYFQLDFKRHIEIQETYSNFRKKEPYQVTYQEIALSVALVVLTTLLSWIGVFTLVVAGTLFLFVKFGDTPAISVPLKTEKGEKE